ncbi:MAG: retron St85 family effector protein [Candidatus Thiodiazotropha taylori]
MLTLLRNKRSLKSKISKLKRFIELNKLYRPKNTSKFVFLCGANKAENKISERRKALLNFSQTNLPHTQFFLAEKVFSLLQDEGHIGNILDIEHKISKFADVIIIILESESAFAELGAFSHKELRNKIIVINDKKFTKSKSFINLGPIKAISETSGDKNILTYKMSKDGVYLRDAIGDIFAPLHKALKPQFSYKREIIYKSSIDPSLQFNKDSVMFIHDLLYIHGPLLHKEIIEILIQLFGNNNFKLKEHLGLLNAFDAIERKKNGIYKSRNFNCYLEYDFDLNDIISTFRNTTLKYHPERMYES